MSGLAGIRSHTLPGAQLLFSLRNCRVDNDDKDTDND